MKKYFNDTYIWQIWGHFNYLSKNYNICPPLLDWNKYLILYKYIYIFPHVFIIGYNLDLFYTRYKNILSFMVFGMGNKGIRDISNKIGKKPNTFWPEVYKYNPFIQLSIHILTLKQYQIKSFSKNWIFWEECYALEKINSKICNINIFLINFHTF